ncbi:LON peptidase substrate-binding domain-containing protein [Pokkaliibacter sp. CJK22405]
MEKLPIFPLTVTGFPYASLNLRIFEPRYLRMISGCMKTGRHFVITPLLSGNEGSPSEQVFADVGCLVAIEDFHELNDGTLGVVVHGEARVRIGEHWQEKDGLWHGDITPWPEDDEILRPEWEGLAELFQAMCANPLISKDSPVRCHKAPSANVLSWKLSSCLPLSPECQLALLQAESAEKRLSLIHHWLEGDMEG